ncbi:MAG: hypothetical protein Q8P30_03960 [Candidatus Uhrbacteria bacterium]|nr:hypothetical protein [Candidatus Uhrbacteria bacterium]
MRSWIQIFFAAFVASVFSIASVGHVFDCYAVGGGLMGWQDGGHLETTQGWSTIANKVIAVRAGLVGYYVLTEDGVVYSTNLTAEPELERILEQLAG